MKSTLKGFAGVTALLLCAGGAAGAQTPPANTGAAANVVAGRDTKWEVSTNGGTIWIQAFQVLNPPSPPWEPNTLFYSWISATSSGTGGGGDYLFRTFFDLSGFDPANATITFQCAVDNYGQPAGSYFSLNGGSYGGTCGQTPTFHFAGTQTVNSGFVGGVNELRFHVVGDNTTDGLVVGNMALIAPTAVPEPASMALLATGLVGIYGAARRRRNTLKS